ncbi:ABC transporter substrate-binding protein, partial [bacterium]|nr:ABC transporter substrate-binding protein [bacterium]
GEHATLGSLRDADPRFRIFSALSRGQVFNMNRKSLGGVSNDYFSVGLSNPHRLIKDLIQIFHPGLLPNHEPEWYHRLR